MTDPSITKMLKMWLAATIAAVSVMSMPSCVPDVEYAESHSIPSEGWSAGDTLLFTPEIGGSDAPQDLYLWVRHAKEYKYSNIWLKASAELEMDDQDGLVEIRLADKTGRWLGTCGQSMCTVKVLLKGNIPPQDEKVYKLSVLQYMREEVLKGVRNVGIEVRGSDDEVEQ